VHAAKPGVGRIASPLFAKGGKMAARGYQMDPGRPSCRSYFNGAVAAPRCELTPHKGRWLSETKCRQAVDARPGGAFVAKLISASSCSLEQPYNEQQNHRTNNGHDESADKATSEMKAQ
jgi:hypothetical protein